MAGLNPLGYIKKYESGGRNVPNYMFGPGYTAQGYFQITNTTWRDIAPKAGIDLGRYPNAMSAPYAVQESAATALYNTRGFQPWAPHNPALRAAIASEGGAGAFIRPGTLTGGDAPAAGAGTVGDWDFGRNFAGSNLGDGAQPIQGEAGSFTDFSDGRSKGTADGLLKGFSRSKDLVEATDKQTQYATKSSQAALTQDQQQYSKTAGTFTDYFARAIFVIVGLIMLAFGLRMFGVPVPKMPNVRLAT